MGRKEKRILVRRRNETAYVLLSAIRTAIDQRSIPEVQPVRGSWAAFKQFISFFVIWVKCLNASFHENTQVDLRHQQVKTIYSKENAETAGKYTGRSFVLWLSTLAQEIYIVIYVFFGSIWVFLKRLIGNVVFQIVRFFTWLNHWWTWTSLKIDILFRYATLKIRTKVNLYLGKLAYYRAMRAEQSERARQIKAADAAFEADKKKAEAEIDAAEARNAKAAAEFQRIQADLNALALRREQELRQIQVEVETKEAAEKELLTLQQADETSFISLEETHREAAAAREQFQKGREAELERLSEQFREQQSSLTLEQGQEESRITSVSETIEAADEVSRKIEAELNILAQQRKEKDQIVLRDAKLREEAEAAFQVSKTEELEQRTLLESTRNEQRSLHLSALQEELEAKERIAVLQEERNQEFESIRSIVDSMHSRLLPLKE